MASFSTQENLSFERASDIFQANHQTLAKAAEFYLRIKSKCELNEQIDDAMMISVFLADLTQDVRDLEGRLISGMGLSFSRLLKNCDSVPLLVDHIRSFMSLVPVGKDRKAQISSYLEQIKINFEYMELFECYIKKIELLTRNPSYKTLFTEMAWMFFIDCRDNYTKLDARAREQNNCLMSSVFYFMIRYSLEHICPKYLADSLKENCDRKMLITKILDFLLNVFQIEDIALFKEVAELFDDYIENRLLDKCILKTTQYSDTDFFAPSIININFKRLSNTYQKKLNPKTIDYRVLRPEYSLSITPIQRKTPIAVKSHIKSRIEKKESQPNIKYMSHRVLHYEEDLNLANSIEMPENLEKQSKQSQFTSSSRYQKNKEKNLINKIHFSNSLLRLPLRNENYDPEILNYITSITKMNRKSNKSFFKKYNELIEMMCKNESRSFGQMVFGIFTSFADCYLRENRQEEVSIEQVCLSFMCLALFFGLSLKKEASKQVLNKILEDLEDIYGEKVDLLEVWSGINFLFNSNEEYHQSNNLISSNSHKIPSSIRNSLISFQQESLVREIWRQNPEMVDEMSQFAANYPKSKKITHFMSSVLEYCEDFLIEMRPSLRLTEDHCIFAYNCMKFILSANASMLLQGHHLDQILMCAIYISGRVEGSNPRFLQIKEAYEEIYAEKRAFSEIFCNILVEGAEEGQDLIGFYNKVFIPIIKPFVPYMPDPQLSMLHSLFQRELILPILAPEGGNQHVLTELQPSKNYSMNKMNILETTKPSYQKNKKKEGNEEKQYMIERPGTKIRVRVQENNPSWEECQTQKNYKSSRYSHEMEESGEASD